MSVENYFLSREGRIITNKALKFMRSLIIKMNPEANAEETKSTYLNWLAYKYAYEGADDIYAYEYTKEDCTEANISSANMTSKKLLNHDACFKLCLKNDRDAMALLNLLRKRRIDNYVEENTYYRQFQGIPRNESEQIYVQNRDKQSSEDPDLLKIQEIDIVTHPYTYDHVFSGSVFDKIKEENPTYTYLKFISDKKSVYSVRNTEQFDILYYDKSILNDDELANFFKIYNKKKLYFHELMYIKGYESRMEMYPFIMELLLLQDVFMSFFNSYMDNYALANYTDQEIYDLLDSYNLSSLKKVSITTLRKIIRDIPDLIELRGSDLIIEKLLDIVADDSVTIKRYYLTKIYEIGANGETRLDTTKTYEDNVDVIFKEKIIRKGNNFGEASDIDYTSFVESDDTWGGDLKDLTTEQKAKIKENFRREILQMDFSKILTKYLTISSTINTYDKQVKVHNYLGLFWQYCRNKGYDFLMDDQINFNAFTIRPIDMYAGICWFYQYFTGQNDPGLIHHHDMNIANVMMLRDRGIDNEVNNITGEGNEQPVRIKLPAGIGDQSIMKILGPHDPNFSNKNPEDKDWPYTIDSDGKKHINYEDVFINFDESTTLSDVFDNYDENVAIINALVRNAYKTSNIKECRAWEYLMKQNQTNVYYQVMFDNETRFDDFLKKNSSDFYNYLIIPMENGNIDTIFNTYASMLDAFRVYILSITDNVLSLPNADTDNESSGSLSYLTDLTILFNEFLSIYTELHKIEYSQVYDDSPYNRIRLLYNFDKEVLEDSLNDKVQLVDDRITKSIFEDEVVWEMMKENKLESMNTRIEAAKKFLKEGDYSYILEKEITEIEKDNLKSFLKEKIEDIEYIRDHAGDLSDDLRDKLAVYNRINLALDEERVIYRDIIMVFVNSYSGINFYEEYIQKEIEELEKMLEEIKNRKDILPRFKYYVSMYVESKYVDWIILTYVLLRDEVIRTNTEKIFLNFAQDKFKEVLYMKLKDKIELVDQIKESPIAYEVKFKQLIIELVYKLESEELYSIEKGKFEIDYKQLKEYLTVNYNDKIKLIDSMKEDPISYLVFMKDYINILTYKHIYEEIEFINKEKIRLDYKPTVLLIENYKDYIYTKNKYDENT